MFGEEVDLCFRAKKLGYSPTFTPEAEIIHYGEASEVDKGNRWAEVFCAKATIIHKHRPQKYIGFGIRMLLFWAASRSVALTTLALFAPEKFGSQKQIWSNVWQKRSEWQR
jgi:N-acetylglucosaminyl-diphospho-decaprenol L-rhamnosyltransferase